MGNLKNDDESLKIFRSIDQSFVIETSREGERTLDLKSEDLNH